MTVVGSGGANWSQRGKYSHHSRGSPSPREILLSLSISLTRQWRTALLLLLLNSLEGKLCAPVRRREEGAKRIVSFHGCILRLICQLLLLLFSFSFPLFFRGHNGLFFLSSLLASRASGLIMFAPEARQCAFVVKSRARDYSMDLVSFSSRCQHVL